MPVNAADSGFENAHAPAQSYADDGADDTGNRYEQQRDNHEDPEQLFQGRDPRLRDVREKLVRIRTVSFGKVLELRDRHTAGSRQPAGRARNPLIFATGYGERAPIPSELDKVPVIQKPYSRDTIELAMGALTRAGAQSAP